LKVQTFTGGQLKKITSAFETTLGGVVVTTTTGSRSRGVQLLRRIKAGQRGETEVRDHRGRSEAAITGGVLRGPVVRDHRIVSPPGTPTRVGFVWVVDHWEREKAKPPELPKVTGIVIDQDDRPVDDAEVTLLNGAVLLNDSTDDNGMFSIENVAAGDYHVTVKKDGYADVEKDIKVTVALDVGKINLSSKHPQESFLLLGVVYRKLPKLPNPIDGESYL
jgi:hypothetical protein